MLESVTKENFNHLLGRFSTNELENLLDKFPYFQQAHVLLAKKYQQENNPKFDEQLQLAVLYSQDRKLLSSIFSEATETFLHKDIQSAEQLQPLVEPIIEIELAKEELPETEIPAIEAATESFIEETPPVREEEKIVESQEAISTEQIETITEEVTTFNISQSHTFGEWLNVFTKTESPKVEINLEEPSPQPEEQDKQLEELIISNLPVQELIEEETHYSKGLDTFIEEQKSKHRPQETKAIPSENELAPELITETMAKIYEMQKKYQKAIQAYETLALKYPKKNDFFAARINYIKSII